MMPARALLMHRQAVPAAAHHRQSPANAPCCCRPCRRFRPVCRSGWRRWRSDVRAIRLPPGEPFEVADVQQQQCAARPDDGDGESGRTVCCRAVRFGAAHLQVAVACHAEEVLQLINDGPLQRMRSKKDYNLLTLVTVGDPILGMRP